MVIREYCSYNGEEILALYSSVGWAAYTADPDALRKGFENSLLVLAAYEDPSVDDGSSALLGLIRVVGDGQTVVLVQDILVKPDHQRQGIGTALLKEVLSRFSHVRQIELVTDNTEKTIAFYRSVGFMPLGDIGCCGFMRV